MCRKSASARRAVKEMCRRDPVFWIDTFVWQFNPNWIPSESGTASLEMGPFICWPYQENAVDRIIWCVNNRKDLVVEKSREMGASWLCLLVMTWPLLFHPWKKFLCISHNEDAVDDHSPDSLFWKIRFILEYTPDWLKPKITDRKLYFGSENGTVISGQATTQRAGVGGRATAMFCDEMSQIKQAYDIIDRTSNTTGCRIFNGTHLGTGTAFYELTNPDSMIGRYVQRLQMHWTEHPDKNKGAYHYDQTSGQIVVHDKTHEYPPDFEFDRSGAPTGGPKPGIRSPWYDEECKRKTRATAIAMDLDIDPQRSVEQLFDPMVIKSLASQYARPPKWQGTMSIEDGELVLTPSPKGHLRLWLTMNADGRAPAGDYFFGFDNAQGVGATPSCGSACNIRGEKVLEFSDPQVEPKEMAVLFFHLFKLFRNEDRIEPMIAWEVPGPGKSFGDKLIEMGYRRFYMRQEKEYGEKKKGPKAGWNNTKESKMTLIVNYRDALKGRQFLNRSESALKDCLNFHFMPDGYIEHSAEQSTKDASGARVNHGDQVIADALALKMLMLSGKLVSGLAEEKKNPAPTGSRRWRELLHQLNERERSWGES